MVDTALDEMTEPLCPFGDGRHKRKPWYERKKGVATGRSGLACIRCGKTWEYVGKALVATYDMPFRRQADA